MAVNINQFKMTVAKGQVDLAISLNSVLTVQVDSGQATPLVAGQAVTMVDSAGGLPKVIAAAAATGDIFGVVAYDQKRPSFAAGDKMEIVFARGGVLYMEASAAIARNAKVMIVVSGSKVATATTSNMIIGRAIDKAAANGDMIRVILDLPGTLAP